MGEPWRPWEQWHCSLPSEQQPRPRPGTGGYAVVRAAVHNETHLRVAVKTVCLPEDDADSLARASSISRRSGLSPRVRRMGLGSRALASKLLIGAAA